MSFDLNMYSNFTVSQAPSVILTYSKRKRDEKKTHKKVSFIARMLIRSTSYDMEENQGKI